MLFPLMQLQTQPLQHLEANDVCRLVRLWRLLNMTLAPRYLDVLDVQVLINKCELGIPMSALGLR